MTKIDTTIQSKVVAAEAEMNDLIKERSDVIHGVWASRIAQTHLLMLGPGGTGKSFLARNLVDHITGGKLFECAFDETTDPSQVFGPPDIKAMVEDGKTRRVPTGMLPEATDAFLDEFFNGNGPLLHSIMPVLNERVFHNNGMPMAVPLRMAIMGTNKLNADADLAALFDRVHLRYVVDFIAAREQQKAMVSEAIARMALVGRGTATNINQSKTTVTLDELDQAHKESLALDVPEPVFEMFFDIREELHHGDAKVVVSDRRLGESMAVVLANAWLRGHDEVKVADLDILANMWWTVQEQRSAVRSVILAATNPGEKAALDLLDELDKLKKNIDEAEASGMDDSRKKRVGVEAVKNADKLLKEAKEHLDKAEAAGVETGRIKETIGKTESFKMDVGRKIFGIDQSTMNNLASV